MNKLKSLFLITNKNHLDKVNTILNAYNLNTKVVSYAKGTASQSMLDYFGLIADDKIMVMALIPDYLKFEISQKLIDYFKLESLGQGLGFVLPITSANKFLIDSFPQDESYKEDEMLPTKENDIKYELIVTIVLEGYIEKVMTAAKKAGATGGTSITGKGMGGKMSKKLFGFVVEPGREIIYIIVPTEIKEKVMEAITSETGIKTDGMGLCFAIPIDSVIGFN